MYPAAFWVISLCKSWQAGAWVAFVVGVTSCDYAIVVVVVVVGRGFGCDLFCPWCHLLNLFVALTHCKDSIKTRFYFFFESKDNGQNRQSSGQARQWVDVLYYQAIVEMKGLCFRGMRLRAQAAKP